MAYDYGPLKLTADRLIERFGVACTVRVTPIASSDLSAGTVTEGAPVNTPARCVLTQITEQNAPGALIEQGDKLAIVDVEVDPQAVIIIDSVVWTVVHVVQVKPGPTFMISKAQVRIGGV